MAEGYSSLEKEEFQKAFTYFYAVKLLAFDDNFQDVGDLGTTVALFKRDGQPISFLTSQLGSLYPPLAQVYILYLFANNIYFHGTQDG